MSKEFISSHHITSAQSSSRLLWLLMIVCCYNLSFAQNENWNIGRSAILQFGANEATIELGDYVATTVPSILYSEGGNLLFYTNSERLVTKQEKMHWGRMYESIVNSQFGKSLSTDDFVHVRSVGERASQRDINYVHYDSVEVIRFVPDEGFEFERDAGNRMSEYGPFSRGMGLIPHPCGGFWVLLRHYTTKNYLAFRLRSDYTLTEEPVRSYISDSMIVDSYEELYMSQRYDRIASIRGGFPNNGTLEIAKFDRNTGKIYDHLLLRTGKEVGGDVVFSPDSDRLYVYERSKYEYGVLVQYDLRDWRVSSILQSKYVVDSIYANDEMALGPDGRIYTISRYGENGALGRVNYPNKRGQKCDYDDEWVQSVDEQTFYRLPNHKFHVSELGGEVIGNILPPAVSICPEQETMDLDTSEVLKGDWYWNNERVKSMPSVLPRTGWNTIEIVDDLCRLTDSMFVDELTPPSLDLGADQSICLDEVVTLLPKENASTYRWSTGDDTPSISVRDTGEYWVRITDEYGCAAVDTIRLSVSADCSCDIYLPTALRPSSTRGNALWRPVSSCTLNDYELQIYDRWGGRVYHSRDATTGWDGSTNGARCVSGTYTYRLSYRLSSEERPRLDMGSIVLVR